MDLQGQPLHTMTLARTLIDRLKYSNIVNDHFLREDDVIISWIWITRPVPTNSDIHNKEKSLSKGR